VVAKRRSLLAAWDIGVQTRLRYEIRDNFAIAGSPGSMDFRDHGADVDNSFLMVRVRPRIGYTGTWFSVFVEGRHSSTTAMTATRTSNPTARSIFTKPTSRSATTRNFHSPSGRRQELSYGDERLIGAFGWNNIGRVFDAAKLAGRIPGSPPTFSPAGW